jgi:hypothetical protein
MRSGWSILALSALCTLGVFGDTLCDSATGTIAADDSTLTGVGSCSVDAVTFSKVLGSNSGTTTGSNVTAVPMAYFFANDSNGGDFFEVLARCPNR